MLNRSLSIITNVLIFNYKATGHSGKQSTTSQIVILKRYYLHIPAIEQLDYMVHDITQDIAHQIQDILSNLSHRNQLVLLVQAS